jgi:hypothetical protein
MSEIPTDDKDSKDGGTSGTEAVVETEVSATTQVEAPVTSVEKVVPKATMLPDYEAIMQEVVSGSGGILDLPCDKSAPKERPVRATKETFAPTFDDFKIITQETLERKRKAAALAAATAATREAAASADAQGVNPNKGKQVLIISLEDLNKIAGKQDPDKDK